MNQNPGLNCKLLRLGDKDSMNLIDNRKILSIFISSTRPRLVTAFMIDSQ